MRDSTQRHTIAGGTARMHRGGTSSALHHRNFRRYFAAQVVSSTGTWVQITVENWLVLELSHSGVALGVTNALHSGVWVSLAHAGEYGIGIQAYDPGVGVRSETLQSPGSPSWGFGARQSAGCWEVQCSECHDLGSFCASAVPGSEPLFSRVSELGALSDGEHTIDAGVEDGVGLSATAPPATSLPCSSRNAPGSRYKWAPISRRWCKTKKAFVSRPIAEFSPEHRW